MQGYWIGKHISWLKINSLSCPLPKVINSPLSLLHEMVGGGEPVAAHWSETFKPSRTTISALVGKSRMSGGTES